MESKTDNVDVRPAKCTQCAKPLSSPPVCDYCHSLNPLPAMTDYFAMLGLPRQFDMDDAELHRRFLALSRHAHPDYHVHESAEAQRLSLTVSAALNDAYRTLKDPFARAGYLLEVLGGKSSAQDKSVPEGFLSTTMMMQEETAEAKAAGDQKELQRLRGVLQTQETGLMRRIAGLFDEYQRSLACQAVRTDLLGELRKQLNAVSYVKKILSLF